MLSSFHPRLLFVHIFRSSPYLLNAGGPAPLAVAGGGTAAEEPAAQAAVAAALPALKLQPAVQVPCMRPFLLTVKQYCARATSLTPCCILLVGPHCGPQGPTVSHCHRRTRAVPPGMPILVFAARQTILAL